jgi:hypothetical protein
MSYLDLLLHKESLHQRAVPVIQARVVEADAELRRHSNSRG